MNAKPVHALPTKGRQRRGMHVQRSTGESARYLGRNELEKASEYDQLHRMVVEYRRQLASRRRVPRVNRRSRYPRVARAHQCACVWPIRRHHYDIARATTPKSPEMIDQRLEVRAATARKNGDARAAHVAGAISSPTASARLDATTKPASLACLMSSSGVSADVTSAPLAPNTNAGDASRILSPM